MGQQPGWLVGRPVAAMGRREMGRWAQGSLKQGAATYLGGDEKPSLTKDDRVKLLRRILSESERPGFWQAHWFTRRTYHRAGLPHLPGHQDAAMRTRRCKGGIHDQTNRAHCKSLLQGPGWWRRLPSTGTPWTKLFDRLSITTSGLKPTPRDLQPPHTSGGQVWGRQINMGLGGCAKFLTA